VSDDEIVSLPVPKKFLMQTMAYVGSLEASESLEPSPPSLPEGNGSQWTDKLLRLATKESGPEMRQGLVEMAKAGDAGITTQELADALGLPKGRASVAGMFGAFGRRCDSRYSVAADDLYTKSYEMGDVAGDYETRLVMNEFARSAILDAANA
jgi:hypothetical protein